VALGSVVTYTNPYVTGVTETVFNYAEPIPAYVESQSSATVVIANSSPAGTTADAPPVPGVAAPPAEPPEDKSAEQPQAQEDPKVKEAVGLFDEARELFKKADYAEAQAKVDKAIGLVPADRVLHEFRGLVLFAQKKYPDAAATLYAVLSAGPGWNWDTIKTFYPDTATYTQQLRALEAAAKENPKAADDRFVLAYQYLVLGQSDPAVKALEQVIQLQPEDKLSTEIVKALKPKPAGKDDRPKASTD
jgi:tetratricopeptide (TPR) repeat protein